MSTKTKQTINNQQFLIKRFSIKSNLHELANQQQQKSTSNIQPNNNPTIINQLIKGHSILPKLIFQLITNPYKYIQYSLNKLQTLNFKCYNYSIYNLSQSQSNISRKMYGRLNQRKLKEDDYVMSCEKVRNQLGDYIDQQAKRVNIDSAKKRAVLQHMDYEGFRQMVLGANIFPTKSSQLYSFSKGQGNQIIPNKMFALNKQDQIPTQKRTVAEQQLFNKVEGKSQLECSSFRQFKKKFNQKYAKQGQTDQKATQHLYNLVKYQDMQRLAKIFGGMDCEANILTKIVQIFKFIISYLRENNAEGKIIKQIAFQIKFLQTVLKLKNMKQFNLSIMSKKERAKIVSFLQTGKQIMSNRNAYQNKSGNHKNKQTTQQQNKGEDEQVIDELIGILYKK